MVGTTSCSVISKGLWTALAFSRRSRTGVELCTPSGCDCLNTYHIAEWYSSAAACIVELAEDGDAKVDIAEADKLMKDLPNLTKKIAGKSLPIEVRPLHLRSGPR